jgi:uncharacterized protein (DUF1330 family)
MIFSPPIPSATGGSMSAYVIARISITDPAGFEQYKQMVPPTIERFGGRYVVRTDQFEVLEGREPRERLVVIEFPSMQALRDWYQSEEYAPSMAQRQASAEADILIVEGC